MPFVSRNSLTRKKEMDQGRAALRADPEEPEEPDSFLPRSSSLPLVQGLTGRNKDLENLCKLGRRRARPEAPCRGHTRKGLAMAGT